MSDECGMWQIPEVDHTVEPQSGLLVCKVLDMQKELTLGFFDVMWTVKDKTNLGQWKDAHHESIIP